MAFWCKKDKTKYSRKLNYDCRSFSVLLFYKYVLFIYDGYVLSVYIV